MKIVFWFGCLLLLMVIPAWAEEKVDKKKADVPEDPVGKLEENREQEKGQTGKQDPDQGRRRYQKLDKFDGKKQNRYYRMVCDMDSGPDKIFFVDVERNALEWCQDSAEKPWRGRKAPVVG